MAKMGLKYMVCAPMATEPDNAVPTYSAGKVLGKMVSMNVAVSNSEGELYADDMLSEYVSEFASAELTAEVDNITLANQAELYGAQVVNDEFQARPDDVPPQICVGGIQVLMVGGMRKYRAWFYPKAKAIMPDLDGATKGSSISFGTQPIKMKVMAPKFGPWYYAKEFDTEAAAKAYVDTKASVAEWYAIDVQVNGAGSDEGASPEGTTMVASAGTFELTIAGTPTALYDNGTESKASISEGKYTLSNVSADHTIAVIY